MKFQVPTTITINEIEYSFSDCDTPAKASVYIQLLSQLQTYDPGIIA